MNSVLPWTCLEPFDERRAVRRRSKPCQDLCQRIPLWRVQHIIAIEPERIVAGGACQRRVAGHGEVIDPHEIEHRGPELAGDLPRVVGAPRIDEHDLVKESSHGGKAIRQVFLLVSYDQGEAHGDFGIIVLSADDADVRR